MSIEAFFNHKCDIYHIRKTEKSPGYNLPSSPSFTYSEKPDIISVSCHFGVKGSTRKILQSEPQASYEAQIKLTLPTGTDIRLNDKVVDYATGYMYTAEIPQGIRGHHIIVFLHRTGIQAVL